MNTVKYIRNGDLNDINKPGCYIVVSCANSPNVGDAVNWSSLYAIDDGTYLGQSTGSTGSQIFVTRDNRIYTRSKLSDTWTSWEKLRNADKCIWMVEANIDELDSGLYTIETIYGKITGNLPNSTENSWVLFIDRAVYNENIFGMQIALGYHTQETYIRLGWGNWFGWTQISNV